ncbi:EscG/YscG/SsaH family type III secretion system needle protein co-chaperone [Trinickia caryophylli]|uniref:Type III secretion system protein, SsaH family n=1 Tax=Trinickia caryophylli TaxID=28094 RepID=A0A1X7EXC9_TRICW|nr:EscG/YscG/SsaH family type III secretion system needle protein co-chaperone [Trinickia caryophylli]PMS09684.1 EscG/YscG/SsaH family type III secretion system needle protein co-chaperone [Trinickia caryophylli]TRX18455.1 EscG/YscG/SsaH family type III secretion system needle protein co-chaperone [Trinickia caryophylli]WQE10760.1 EscG/YscG/SsaH family type III secretion system needle protein co-chaperone [Trinickia caryophylli]SMF41635.1 type III secretion system protein, SsaH family [Trinicki
MNTETRQLIVEAGLAAVNHGLLAEARAIRDALPDLVAAPELRRLLDAAILIGLGERDAAAKLLQADSSSEAQLLRTLLQPAPAATSRAPVATGARRIIR